MKLIWFKQIGWFYMPTHAMGVVTTLLAVIFLIPIYTAITSNGHSVSDDLYQMFVYTTCTGFWWKWVAEKTSSGNNKNQ